ncbi:MAG TPA: hypothetical protein VD794_16335 [Flavisolibacter sp.]|nr:hypothetical protein [Flavisolibacter sp.]
MSNFSKTFNTDKGIFLLTFTRIESLTSYRYFVTAETSSFLVARFEMKQTKEGNWKVIAPAPDCVQEAESKLSTIINENSKSALQLH